MSVFPTAPSYHVHTVRLRGGGRYYQVVANRVHDDPVHGLWTEHRVLAVYANGGPEQYHKALARRDAARLAGEWPDDRTVGADA